MLAGPLMPLLLRQGLVSATKKPKTLGVACSRRRGRSCLPSCGAKSMQTRHACSCCILCSSCSSGRVQAAEKQHSWSVQFLLRLLLLLARPPAEVALRAGPALAAAALASDVAAGGCAAALVVAQRSHRGHLRAVGIQQDLCWNGCEAWRWNAWCVELLVRHLDEDRRGQCRSLLLHNGRCRGRAAGTRPAAKMTSDALLTILAAIALPEELAGQAATVWVVCGANRDYWCWRRRNLIHRRRTQKLRKVALEPRRGRLRIDGVGHVGIGWKLHPLQCQCPK